MGGLQNHPRHRKKATPLPDVGLTLRFLFGSGGIFITSRKAVGQGCEGVDDE